MTSYHLPTPAEGLQVKIWSSLEQELLVKPAKTWFWSKLIYGGAASVLVVTLIVTKIAVHSASTAQFNDLDRDLALVEQNIIEDFRLSNLEWELDSLEGESYESSY